MNDFVHLHVHSQYSLLDGQASIQNLVDKAVADDMKAIALKDHGAMFGIKEFFRHETPLVESIFSGRSCRIQNSTLLGLA